LEWRGYLLTVEEVTHKAAGKKHTQATVVMKTADGTGLAKEVVSAHKEDFVLDYQGYSLSRPSSARADKDTLKLVFQVKNIPSQDFEGEDCVFYVSPVERGRPEIMGTPLFWKGYRLRLDRFMNDGLAVTDMIRERYPERDSPVEDRMPDLFWSQQFVLAEITAFSEQKGVVPDGGNLREMAEALMLESGDADACSPVLTFVRKSSFQAVFIADLSVPLADMRLAMPETKPFPAGPLWVSGNWDDDSGGGPSAADAPFSEFIPQYPERYACALMLEDASAFRPARGKARPRQHMREAMETLEDDLYEISAYLTGMFGDGDDAEELTVTDDPDEASVIIGVNIQFPSAGKVRDEDDRERAYPAFQYSLTLTAYDAVTHRKIGRLKASNRFGGGAGAEGYGYEPFWMSDDPGDGTEGIVQSLPDLSEASGRHGFVNALNAFWKNWEPPAAKAEEAAL